MKTKTKNGTKGAAKSPAKTKGTGQGARASASTPTADETPTPAAAPVAAALDREKASRVFREYWGKVFQSSAVVYARRVAALFGLDWPALESWMCDCIAGRVDPSKSGDDTPQGGRRRKWWDMPILEVYGLFYALKANGASADDCEKCVAVVAPFALEYWRAPSRVEEIEKTGKRVSLVKKGNDSFFASDSEGRAFFGALTRLERTAEAFASITPPPLAKGRAGARKVDLRPPSFPAFNPAAHFPMIEAFCGFLQNPAPPMWAVSAQRAVTAAGMIDARMVRGAGGIEAVFDAFIKWTNLPENREKWKRAAAGVQTLDRFKRLLRSIRDSKE